MLTKSLAGAFYTHNKDLIKDLKLPGAICEPFAGAGDLLKLYGECEYQAWDLQPEQSSYKITQRDSLLNPPWLNQWILTNPPYLAKNKSGKSQATVFKKYKEDDLYKCFIRALIDIPALGGIVIIPINFLLSHRKKDRQLRSDFINVYNITSLKIFEKQMFKDTTSSVCTIAFISGKTIDAIPTVLYNQTETNLSLNFDELDLNLPESQYKICRWVSKNKTVPTGLTSISIKCVDDNKKICAFWSQEYCDTTQKASARSYITLVITPELSLESQELLIEQFNDFITELRKKTCGLFLVSFREKNRKRISFEQIYKITSFLLRP